MLRYGIPSYKLEKDLLAAEIDVIRQLGVEIRCGVEVGKDVTIEDLREQGYKGFYAAIGCQRGRKPGISGENAEGAYTAVDFLRKAGAKESFALEGDVVVVGGGNVAIDAARISSRCIDAKISMFCLEAREKNAGKQRGNRRSTRRRNRAELWLGTKRSSGRRRSCKRCCFQKNVPAYLMHRADFHRNMMRTIQ